jgi:hypothetical protein
MSAGKSTELADSKVVWEASKARVFWMSRLWQPVRENLARWFLRLKERFD